MESDQIMFRATQRLESHKFLIKLFLFDFENSNFYSPKFLLSMSWLNIFFFIRKLRRLFENFSIAIKLDISLYENFS